MSQEQGISIDGVIGGAKKLRTRADAIVDDLVDKMSETLNAQAKEIEALKAEIAELKAKPVKK